MADRLNRRERRIIKGNTVTEQLDSIDKAMTRMHRHLNHSATVVMPPLPISSYAAEVPEGGDILRFMFPLKGIVRRLVISIGKMDVPKGVEKIASVRVSFISKGIETIRSVKLRKGLSQVNLDVSVEVGDKVTLYGEKGDGTTIVTISDIWFSLLLEIEQKEANVKSMVLAGLEKAEDETIEALASEV
jgi:hypothetical protein